MHTHAPVTEATIKVQAQLLKSFLQSRNTPLNHMACLDAVSVQYGYPSWQHARAALAQQQFAMLSPQASEEEKAKQVADLIVQVGAVHEPVLLHFAKALLQSNLTPTYSGEYKVRTTPTGVERECHLLAQQPFGPEYDLSVSAKLLFELRFEGDVLHIEPTVMLDVGSEYEIDWQCYYSGDEYLLSFADPAWEKKLRAFMQGIPVKSWVQEELDAQGTTLEVANERFGKILFGA